MQKKTSINRIETSNDVYESRSSNQQPGRLPLEIVWRDPSSLKDHEEHARRHSHQQIRKLARSIEEFGIVLPVLVDASSVIIAGHALVAAAKRLELPEIPVTEIRHLSDAQVRALRLALNRLAEDGTWDEDKLRVEFQNLVALSPALELTSTGFEAAEIDRLLIVPAEDDEEALPPLPDVPVSRPGDLWRLGPHLLLCGNALEATSYDALLRGEKVRLIFTDPPYNVPVAGHIRGNGRVRHDEFVMASGELDDSSFISFLQSYMSHAVPHSLPGALHLSCMDWRHMGHILAAGSAAYGQAPINLIVWAKENAGQGSLYRSRHELIFLWKVGKAPHVNNIRLGKHGRYRSNVWTSPGVNSFGKGREQALADHPTVKPLSMVVDAIPDLSERDELVLDPFGGSGTTLFAAEKTGRRARLMELDPRYVDLIIRRWRERGGGPAVELNSGLDFDTLARLRMSELELEPMQHTKALSTTVDEEDKQ